MLRETHMPSNDPLKYVLHRSGILPPAFGRWVRSSRRFRGFVDEYKDRICAKFAEAGPDPEPDEKLKDTLFELEIAYLALRSSRFSSVEYEPYGDGPDFRLTARNGVVFNMEAKRIRKAREERRLEAWRAEVAGRVRGIPSTLAVAVNIGADVDELGALLDLLGRLESGKSDVIDDIVRTIRAEESSIPMNGVTRYQIPGFCGELELVLSRPLGKPCLDHTTFNGGALPVFLTTQEWKRFKALVFPKTGGQRIPGMINLLAINTDSATHDQYALMEEIDTDFRERVAQGNVTEQMKMLSGILFRGAWGNLLWLNEVACCPIPADLAEALQRLIGHQPANGELLVSESGLAKP
jgi:hypothetical protein